MYAAAAAKASRVVLRNIVNQKVMEEIVTTLSGFIEPK
mgnify:CR=1 FL=1